MSNGSKPGPRLFRQDESGEYFFIEGCHIIETFNSPHDEQVSIVRARVEPGVTTQWHRLDGITERYVILQGQGLAWVGDDRYSVGPGDVLLIPPMVRQRITNTGVDDLLFLAVCSPRFTPGAYLAAG